MKIKYALLLVMLCSCVQNTKVKSKKLNDVNSTVEVKKETVFSDTIAIDYRKYKTLFTVLKQLPETTMKSWEWSKEDRVKTVAFIKKNNYFIYGTEMYHNIKYFKPNTIGIQVVDGVWTLSIYEFNKNNYFIVTNEIVGDGNDIHIFNFINNKITPLKMINWFGNSKYELLLNNSQNCIELLEDNQLSYDYDFSDKDIVEISTKLNRENSEHCFKGNTIKYMFNKQNNTIDIVAVYWENDIVVDSLKKVENPTTLSIQELMLLTKTQANKKYGMPSFSEQFILDDAQGEFRVEISDKFTRKERQSESILIDEVTWEKDNNTWVTIWYEVKQEKYVSKHFLIWKKETEF